MSGIQPSTAPGLYIHVPFCRSKCPYCAFYSVASGTLIPRWVDALKREVLLYKDRFRPFDTIYFGGGTPTLLPTGVLAGIMEHVFSHLGIDPVSEITIEANPCDLNLEKIRALKAMGFNRVSMGVQSFDDQILTFLGRTHRAEEAEKAILDLRSAGIENLSLDLIYGFKEQSKRKWIETLRQAVSFQPEHLSCYQLTIEDKTRFKKMMDDSMLRPLNNKGESSCFMITSCFLEKCGYVHYEISSFSREEKYFSRHNQKYWRHTPYLGLGPSAHSFLDSCRWWNVRSVRDYCEALERGMSPVEGSERLSDEELRFEAIFLGLRTRDGFDQSVMPEQTSELLLGPQDSGLVKLDNGKVIPTRKGFLVADHLACCLADA